MNNPLFARIDELENEYIDFWADICNIESPTEDKEAIDKVSKYIIEKAKKRGWQIEVQSQEVSGDAVCITMNPLSNNAPVCFSAHMDTVHPIGFFGENPVKIEDGKIYGPGVTDCKGGIASSFMAMAALDDVGFTDRPVKLILQSDEENSSRNSNKTTVDFMVEKAKDAVAFLNCEGYSKGSVIIERKGIRKYKFEITGKACHASRCYNGASAIREAAYKIIELEKMKDAIGLTCNCGLISGGTAENSVPEKCTFTADIRFKTKEQMAEADRLVQEISQKSFVDGTRCEAKLISWRHSMELTEKNTDLLNKVNSIFAKNNMDTVRGASGNGGSDAADTTFYGIPTLDDLGVRGEGIHSIREFAYLESLKESAKMLAIIASEI